MEAAGGRRRGNRGCGLMGGVSVFQDEGGLETDGGDVHSSVDVLDTTGRKRSG